MSKVPRSRRGEVQTGGGLRGSSAEENRGRNRGGTDVIFKMLTTASARLSIGDSSKYGSNPQGTN